MTNEATARPREALEERGALGNDTVAARVDGKVYDLHTPIPEGAAEVKPIGAHDADALAIIRHSSAHVMADAVQRLFPGTKVAFGPATEDGFYYDYARPDGTFSEEDLRAIEDKMVEIVGADSPFRREVVTRDEARALLESLDENFKLEHLERLEDPISLYRHGEWVDLCEGPHVPSTGFLKAVKLTSVAGAYWRGDERNPMLQRIYGTAFPSPKALRAHLKQLEEAKKRDHRKLGKELKLFAFHPHAPASPFFLPRGSVDLQPPRKLRPLALRAVRLRRGDHPADLRQRALSHLGAPAVVRREHVHGGDLREPRKASEEDRREAAAERRAVDRGVQRVASLRGEADELPESLPDVRDDQAELPRPTDAHGRLRASASLRAKWRGPRAHPRSHVCAGRRAHLLHARPGAGRDQELPRPGARRVPRLRFHRRAHRHRDAAGEASWRRRGVGPVRDRRWKKP